MVDRHPVYRAPCHLRRIAAADNVWRYYTLTLWPDLFGGTTLVREWGRIGQDGTVMRQHFTDDEAAERELDRIARSKVRRGYRPLAPQDRRRARPDARTADVAPARRRHPSHARSERSPATEGCSADRPCAATRHAMRAPQDTADRPEATAAAWLG